MYEHTTLYNLVHPVYKYFRQGYYVSSSKIDPLWKDKIKQDPELKSLSICIKIILSGDKQVNIATKYVSSYDSSSNTNHVFLPILSSDLSIEERISENGGMSGSRSISIEMPNSHLKADDLLNNNRFIAGIAEVSYMYDGIPYDKRIIIMRGSIDNGVKFDSKDGGSISFSITDPKSTLDNVIPSMVVTPSALNNPRYDAIGQTFPLVIGDGYPYVPIIFHRFSTQHVEAVIAIGHQWSVDAVYRDGSLSTFSTSTQSGVLSSTGGSYKIIKSSVFGVNVLKLVGSNLTVGWPDLESATVYAAISANSIHGSSSRTSHYNPTSVLDVIKHIIMHHTHTGSSGINEESFAFSNETLSTMRVKCLINSTELSSRATALSYIGGEVCQSFPMVSVSFTGAGIAAFVIDRRKNTVMEFTLGGKYIYDRISEISESPKTSLYNSFVYKYKYNALDNAYEGCVVRTPHNSTLCLLARDYVGDRSYATIQSNIVHDSATANYIIDWLVSHKSIPHYKVSYSFVLSIIFKIKLGDNILLNDSELGWESKIATVVGISYNDGYAVVQFIVWSEFSKIGGSSMDAKMSINYRKGSN